MLFTQRSLAWKQGFVDASSAGCRETKDKQKVSDLSAQNVLSGDRVGVVLWEPLRGPEVNTVHAGHIVPCLLSDFRTYLVKSAFYLIRSCSKLIVR